MNIINQSFQYKSNVCIIINNIAKNIFAMNDEAELLIDCSHKFSLI